MSAAGATDLSPSDTDTDTDIHTDTRQGHMKPDWTTVEADLLDNVFYAFDAAQVRASDDLPKDGMLDSLSIVAILEALIEATGQEEAFDDAQADDFRNLAAIRELYERI